MKKLFFAVIAACVLLAAATGGFSIVAEADRGKKALPSEDGISPLPIIQPTVGIGEASEDVSGTAVGLVSEFATSFDTGSVGRSCNIALAASNFCWLKVGEGERLSFNATVGPRTEQRGYHSAKVIENGEYVVGIGGGVCQVSTTLYNAWIRAGLAVESVRAHSLPSSYCELSQDATVSEFIDLVLVNDGDGAVYIDAEAAAGTLTFRVYGTPRTERFEFGPSLRRVRPSSSCPRWTERTIAWCAPRATAIGRDWSA